MISNTNLETLNLDSNRLGDAGAVSIARGLKHNTGLRRLVLNGNDIANEGAAALADALTHNTALQVGSLFFDVALILQLLLLRRCRCCTFATTASRERAAAALRLWCRRKATSHSRGRRLWYTQWSGTV